MGHPVACAASLAVMNYIQSNDLLARVEKQGAYLEAGLREIFQQNVHVGDIRGRGLFWAVELVADRETRKPFARKNQLAKRIKQTAQDLGLICYPSPGASEGIGDHVLLAPPFTISSAQIDELTDKLQDAVQSELAISH
jgi:adenosylmethionine-8-amino-7-oxononanoate aminotransferase